MGRDCDGPGSAAGQRRDASLRYNPPMAIPRLKAGSTALLVVDLQDKLVAAMREPQRLVSQAGRLIDGANVLGMPVLVTEQYRKGLGDTVPELAPRLVNAVCREEKLKFSACIEPVRAHLVDRQVRAVVVCGIEAHVCVLQSCLDLLEAGYITAIAVDAISSRRAPDQDAALQRLSNAGAIVTTVESALFEMMHEAGTDLFRRMLPLVK